MEKTKIVCTLGPASETVEIMTQMVKLGMRIARVNFSHGTHENHAMLIQRVRDVSRKLRVPVLIMQDLQGPKIRVVKLSEPISLEVGQKVVLGKDFDLDYNISETIKPKHSILIEDGLIELVVDSVQGRLVVCTVKTSGVVRSNKGVNLPHTKLSIPAMTEKDVKDLEFGISQNVDLVALSFVRRKSDIEQIRKLIDKFAIQGAKKPKVIAKIEKPEAVKNFETILKAVDGVMIARGDLGVEIPASQVPLVQKKIVALCRKAKKPVIVATQMLDSMIRNPRATRAEVSDVANAVMEGASYVMLSGETAFGSYPLEAVRVMHDTIVAVEKSPYRKK